MSDSSLSRDMALRIGLAARMLPDTSPARLLKVLEDAVGLPPDPERLAALTPAQFKGAAEGELAELPGPLLKDALAVLQGKADGANARPQAEPYREGEMPDSIRVACASNGGERLDGHFGSCDHFLIYQVSQLELRLVEVRPADGAPQGMEKNEHRAALVEDCQLLFVNSIGGPAAAKVVKHGVHPIKHPQGGPARERLAALQPVLAGTPPPWLAKSMGKTPTGLTRFVAEAVAETQG
jgi:nitrogen fixation protein NifX